MPGMMASMGYCRTTSRALLSMEPHSGSGACTPRPRKDREEAVRIEVPRLRVMLTMIWETELGMM